MFRMIQCKHGSYTLAIMSHDGKEFNVMVDNSDDALHLHVEQYDEKDVTNLEIFIDIVMQSNVKYADIKNLIAKLEDAQGAIEAFYKFLEDFDPSELEILK